MKVAENYLPNYFGFEVQKLEVIAKDKKTAKAVKVVKAAEVAKVVKAAEVVKVVKAVEVAKVVKAAEVVKFEKSYVAVMSLKMHKYLNFWGNESFLKMNLHYKDIGYINVKILHFHVLQKHLLVDILELKVVV